MGTGASIVTSWVSRWSSLRAARARSVAPGTLEGEFMVRDWCLASALSGTAMSLRPPAVSPRGWRRHYGFLCRAVRDARKAYGTGDVDLYYPHGVSDVSVPSYAVAYFTLSRVHGCRGLTPLISAFRGWIGTLLIWLTGSASAADRGETRQLQELEEAGMSLPDWGEEVLQQLRVGTATAFQQGGGDDDLLGDLPQLVERHSFVAGSGGDDLPALADEPSWLRFDSPDRPDCCGVRDALAWRAGGSATTTSGAALAAVDAVSRSGFRVSSHKSSSTRSVRGP